ncbi:hypothetical protein [Flavobacterium hercynium]|nr:hypothetical protein [Flavobacterium hercynium]
MFKKLLDNFTSVLPNAYLFYEYLSLWLVVNPDPIAVKTLCVLISFEFIMVHSAIFMAAFQRKFSIIFFILVYGLFAYEFDKMLPLNDKRIMIAYLLVVLFRMRFAFFNVSKKQQDKLLGFSGLAAVIYILSIGFCAIFSDSLPRLNYTKAFASENVYDGSSYGLSEESAILMSTGTIYYFLLVISYLYNSYLEECELKKQKLSA